MIDPGGATERGGALPVTVRRFRDDDAEALCEIFFRSVREVAPARYDDAQVRSWAPTVPDVNRWRPRMREFDTFVAVRDDDVPVGWIALDGAYVDMLYCAPEAAGRGVAARLYAAAEAVARERGFTRLTADCSQFAESFLGKHGWVVDDYEVIARDGVEIPRARMSKTLIP